MRTRLQIAALLLAAPVMAAPPPATVVYQGYVVDGDEPLFGSVDLYFALYDVETGGTPLWTHSASNVTAMDGLFQVELPIGAADLTSDDLWLGIAIDTPDNEFTPRQPLGSAPWALQGGETLALGGQPGSALQLRVTGDCPVGSGIRAVNSDGSVVCQPDAGEGGSGVSSLTAGDGLLGSSTTGDVTLDVAAGAGLTITGDALEVVFGGSGALEQAARSDHDHAGVLLPASADAFCVNPGDKATGFDVNGNIECGTDRNTVYSAGTNLVLNPSNEFDLAPDVVFPDGMMAADYWWSNPGLHLRSLSFHASDLDPEHSNFMYWQAPSDAHGSLTLAGTSTMLYAPLHLPDGTTITSITMISESCCSAPNCLGDLLSCALHVMDPATGDAYEVGYVDAPLGSSCGTYASRGSGFGEGVDNSRKVYTLACEIADAIAIDLWLVGVYVDYEAPGPLR